MLLTDLNGPLSVQPRRAGFGRISRPSRFTALVILFVGFASFGATISLAQDQQDSQNHQDKSVAEAARQERARKQELQKHSAHVYTNDDLRHAHILTPADRAVVEAKRNECAQKNNCSPARSKNSPASLDANSQTTGTSLGEVARRYRKQKELQALKPKQAEPFHLSIGTPALASPILPERPEIRLPVQPELRPKISSHVFRRDPFSAVPARSEIRRPEIRRHEVRVPEIPSTVREDVLPAVRPNVHPDFAKVVRPTLRSRVRLTSPTRPKFVSRLAAPGLFLQPSQPPVPSKDVQPVAPAASASWIRPEAPKSFSSAASIAMAGTVSVARGDSLWKLAQKNLGHGNRWREFLAVNPGIVNPNQIRAGAQIFLPANSATMAADQGRSATSPQTVQVRKGDTLWALAKSTLGRSSDWPCLAASNPSIGNPNRIYEGQHLLVPTSCAPNVQHMPSATLQKPQFLSPASDKF